MVGNFPFAVTIGVCNLNIAHIIFRHGNRKIAKTKECMEISLAMSSYIVQLMKLRLYHVYKIIMEFTMLSEVECKNQFTSSQVSHKSRKL